MPPIKFYGLCLGTFAVGYLVGHGVTTLSLIQHSKASTKRYYGLYANPSFLGFSTGWNGAQILKVLGHLGCEGKLTLTEVTTAELNGISSLPYVKRSLVLQGLKSIQSFSLSSPSVQGLQYVPEQHVVGARKNSPSSTKSMVNSIKTGLVKTYRYGPNKVADTELELEAFAQYLKDHGPVHTRNRWHKDKYVYVPAFKANKGHGESPLSACTSP